MVDYPNSKDYHEVADYNGNIDMHEVKKTSCSAYYNELVPGNVVTIEPGIYFIDCLIEKAKNSEKISKYFDFELVEQYKVCREGDLTRSTSEESALRMMSWLLKPVAKFSPIALEPRKKSKAL